MTEQTVANANPHLYAAEVARPDESADWCIHLHPIVAWRIDRLGCPEAINTAGINDSDLILYDLALDTWQMPGGERGQTQAALIERVRKAYQA